MKVILDMDLGVDDAVALAYALANPAVELVGVTGSYGNVYLEQGVANAKALLALFGGPEVPVLGGIPHALDARGFERLDASARIHGQDGVGNVGAAYGLDVPAPAEALTGGVEFIVDAARRYGKELALVVTGPLTNVAAALRLDPAAMRGIGKIVFMGGALAVTGNVTPCAEANIYQDPLACKEVFESGIDVTMVGLDVTCRCHLTEGDVRVWRDMAIPAASALADMVCHYIGEHAWIEGMRGRCYIHDPLAVICALHPEWFDLLRMPLTCLTEGPCAGRTCASHQKVEYGPEAATVACVGVDVERVEAELRSAVAAFFEGMSAS